MKRSVAMMACVLSGALMIGSYSPVFAEGAKAVSAKSAEQETTEDDKNGRRHQKMPKQTTPQKVMFWKMVSTQQSLIRTAPCSM